MATNEIFEPVGKLSVPVSGTPSSNDPVLVFDEIPGVVTVSDGEGGNPAGSATVAINPKWVFELAVNAATAAIAVGDRVYVDGDDINDDATNGTFYGWALEAVASGATTTIRVLLADGPLA